MVATAGGGAERSRLPSKFVYLSDIDASILQDIRYAGRANFTGARVPGYVAGECILLRQVAEALKLVQADLRQRSLSLKVYDCYRPVRAVRSFMHWVGNPEPGEAQFWPRTQRSDLVKLGYIASSSVHSTGAAVDLTLVKLPVASSKADPNATYAPCNASTSREPDNSLDMGTTFDCFDPMSHTASSEITSEQRENRRLLVGSMAAHGFKNYDREWWHFTYIELPSIPKVQDFLVAK
ncbi:M15 family metallopeptidase [Nitrobacter vulgaris]|uniref:M15 family metallopeptidase n=1 Tax=Nitrobacter vulgaris TaxID=29421 RepID=UPI00286CB634|nr:M15 family metallopeptidase [Nitrobacter vulgaris]